jgi:probable phosphoglycerate mutase
MSNGPATTLILVRHGESLATVNRVIGGPRSCRGLSDLGHHQARLLARRLSETREADVNVLYSSGYQRAIQTAAHLEAALGCDTLVETGLGEHDPGPQCDGLSYAEFIDRFGSPDWESDPHATVFPGGETVAQFHARVHRCIDVLLERHCGLTVMVVCHGGVIDAVIRRALSTPVVGVFEMWTQNASLSELVGLGHGRWRLVRYNDASHLVDARSEPVRLEGSS